MTDEIIKFETAKLAKEKGFIAEGYHLSNIETFTATNLTYELPSQSLLQRWLREKHKLVVYIKPHWYEVAGVKYEPVLSLHSESYIECSTYEDALEIGLVTALKLIKV